MHRIRLRSSSSLILHYITGPTTMPYINSRAMSMALLLCALLMAVVACAAPKSTKTSDAYTISLTPGKHFSIPEENLTITLIRVNDSRCPAGAKCVWAGQASVTLQVNKVGVHEQSLIIGTPVPKNINLSSDAIYDTYRFNLVSLDPEKSHTKPATSPGYRAVIQITKLPVPL